MNEPIPKNFVIFEMANNHMGDLDHGVKIIQEFGSVCREFPGFNFAFKLQYRNLDTFIHPAMQGRSDIKFIKRFEETRLTRSDFDRLVSEMRENGFLAMSTAFDEDSVSVIEEQGLDIIKVASCSFNDWPLLERVAETNLPVIASTAGATLNDIDRVVSFLQHRKKNFAIMHCVGEYPTPDAHLHLSQIDFFRGRYPGVKIGFSTHEDPASGEIVKLAIAKGAEILEKHVGVPTTENPLNAYSADPTQVRAWLRAAEKAQEICGCSDRRPPENRSEAESLRSLRRGMFAARDLPAGESLTREDIYFAFPPEDGQFASSDWSKYSVFSTSQKISKDGAIAPSNATRRDNRTLVWEAAQRVKTLIEESRIVIPGGVDLELSHHYGMDRFLEIGLTMITVVNRDYCKKILVSLPGQLHPEQYHKKKEETFHILYGEVELSLDGVTETFGPGDVINIEPEVCHSFISHTGAVIEEISSTHFKDDSFYTDDTINKNTNRKTLLTYWMS